VAAWLRYYYDHIRGDVQVRELLRLEGQCGPLRLFYEHDVRF